MRTPHLKANDTDVQYLSSFISRNGVGTTGTTKIAKKVLSHIRLFDICGSMDTDLKDFGLNDIQIQKIRNAYNLVKRSQTLEVDKKQLLNSNMIKDFIINNTEAFDFNDSSESFYIMGFSVRQCVKGVSFIARGSASEVTVSINAIAREAIKMNVPRIILIHNHPSGQSSPSDADLTLTIKVRKALEPLGIDVIDHIIIGQGNYYSFADKGMFNTDF